MSDKQTESQKKLVTEALEGINSLLAHVAIKGKTTETRAMGMKLAKKIDKMSKKTFGKDWKSPIK